MTENIKIQTVLGEETYFNGEMVFEKPLQINGRFKGELNTPGHIFIAETAKIDANIKAGSVILAGEVRGNIYAKLRIEMLPTAKLFGNITTMNLKIADGVIFEGRCEMIKKQKKEEINNSANNEKNNAENSKK